MKLRIVTSMLLMMFLSVGSFSVASAHEGCEGGHHCSGWGHGDWGWGHRWGGNRYVYGPDGLYAQCRDGHKSCCDKDKDMDVDAASHKCDDKCGDYCGPRYRRAYYHEDCCGYGYLSCEEHKSCCDKDKHNDDKDN